MEIRIYFGAQEIESEEEDVQNWRVLFCKLVWSARRAGRICDFIGWTRGGFWCVPPCKGCATSLKLKRQLKARVSVWFFKFSSGMGITNPTQPEMTKLLFNFRKEKIRSIKSLNLILSLLSLMASQSPILASPPNLTQPSPSASASASLSFESSLRLQTPPKLCKAPSFFCLAPPLLSSLSSPS